MASRARRRRARLFSLLPWASSALALVALEPTPAAGQGLEAGPAARQGLVWQPPDPSELREVYGVSWKVDVGTFELLSTGHEEWTRPVIGQDGAHVYIASREGRLEARTVGDGRLVFVREGLGAVGADMLEHGREVLVGAGLDVVALDRLTGEEQWRVELGGRIGGEITRTGTIAIFPVRPNGFVAIDLVAHERIWQVKRPTPDNLTVRGQARPTVDRSRGVAYLGFSDGVLLAVSLADGATRWAVTLGEMSEFFADVDAGPVLLEGGRQLLTAAYNRGLFRLDAASGAVLWTRDLKRLIALTPTRMGLVVASHGEGQLIGLDPGDGKVVWRYLMRDGAPSQAQRLPNDLIAASSSRGAMSIVRAADGRPVQLVAPGSGSSVPPAVSGHSLVLFSNGGLVLAMRKGLRGSVILR